MNPLNGTGPCDIVDAAATTFAGSTNTLAICLLDGNDFDGGDLNTGDIFGFAPKFAYPGSMTAVNGPFDTNTDLDANPDFNQALGGAWDCNAFNNAGSQPVASPSPASMGCTETGAGIPPTAAPMVVAIMTYSTPAAAAVAPLTWDGGATVSYGSTLDASHSCGAGGVFACQDATITVLDAADLVVSKVQVGPIVAGGQAVFDVTVTNNGPAAAPNVVITDSDPAGLTADVASTAAFNGPTPCASLLPGSVSCGGGGSIPLAPAASKTVRFFYDVPLSMAGKLIVNTAVAADFQIGNPLPTENVPDPDLHQWIVDYSLGGNLFPGPSGIAMVDALTACAQEQVANVDLNQDGQICDNADTLITGAAPADATITKSGSPDPVNAGSQVTWTVTVTSTGASPMSEIVITDTVDANQTIVSASVDVGNCTETGTSAADIVGQTATCTSDVASLPNGNSIIMTVVADVDNSPPNRTCENDADVTYADPITEEASASVQCFPPTVRMNKDIDTDVDGHADIESLGNLWICDNGPNCWDPNNPTVNNGNGHLVIFERLFNANDADGVGAFEFQLKFDHKIFDINVFHGVDLNGDGDCQDPGEDQAQDIVDDCYLYQTGRVPGIGGCAVSIVNENAILFGCVSKNPNPPAVVLGPMGPQDIVATVHVDYEPDMKDRLHPGQKNGVVERVFDENCEAADIWGDPLGTGSFDDLGREILLPGIVTGGLIEECTDVMITERILEADLDTDCDVDVVDDQKIAFRYGSSFGSLFYDDWYDLEPALKDFDVDIKDLQKVFGRNGSTCQSPLPDQDPIENEQGFDPDLP
jgi:fimbrial isopeptide formation D2 family protein/uncharacterized repeat protein (TIGR01451 family)